MHTKRTKLTLLSSLVVAAGLLIVFAENSFEGPSGPEKEQVKRGAYLVNLGGCNDCHSPKVMTKMGPMPDTTRILSGQPSNEQVPFIPEGLFTPTGWAALSNGHFTAWAGPWGVSYAANLTPDNVTGIGAWTEESFIKALRTGKHLGTGREILPPMPWPALAQLPDSDLKAIFAYLKSLKPVVNQVPLPVPPKQQ